VSIDSEVIQLGEKFWSWRRTQQPRSHDDITRIARNPKWMPSWSASDVAKYREQYLDFLDLYSKINVGKIKNLNCDKTTYVDYRILGSAIARVKWEIDILKIWQQQPRFYIDQSIGVIFDHLLPEKLSANVISEVINAFSQTPRVLSEGVENLKNHAVKSYAEVAIELLANIDSQIRELVLALSKITNSGELESLNKVSELAIQSFLMFRDWLTNNLESFAEIKPVGRDNYVWFFNNVALVPFTPEYMREVGQIEWDRAVTLESITKNRYRKVPVPPIPKSAVEQSENERVAESSVRSFYESEGLLTQPETLKHYLNAPMPDYLRPIRWLGVTDDLTDSSRLNINGISYVPDPNLNLPYFYAANARDPRAGIVHEGAHYQQLAISWRHPRLLRQFYYDSGVNEGIAFYNEELMLAAGLFVESPHTQIVMYNFIKLRAMRVIVDVNLAIGEIDIATATSYLEKKVPMDNQTAHEEAVFFSSCPGQALTYQIGKTQILKMYSDSVSKFGTSFEIKSFHDYLWLNGNVPISLLRFEYLDDISELEIIENKKREME
jgi:hypothetical protein